MLGFLNIVARGLLFMFLLALGVDLSRVERQHPLLGYLRRAFFGAAISVGTFWVAALEHWIDFIPAWDLYEVAYSYLVVLWLPTLVPLIQFWWALHRDS